ncbi:MAG: DegQ family serine endoprotease [Betaproteobacteria bacterium]|nr:DegQ family serine endoprotease [Betaproteobacteria bacterium]
MNKSVVASAVAAAFATGLFAAQFGLEKALVGETHAVPKTVAVDPSSPTGSSTPTLSGNLPDFSALVESQGPAVVNISVSKVVKNGVPNGMQGVPEDLQEFFRRFQPQPRGPEDGSPVPQGVGSGFIISPDGYVLTNAHVVKDADEVTVRLTDHRDFPGKVIGVDSRTDVALLKIDADNLPSVRVGSPDSVKVGNWVAAIGSPFGLENTVTAGIVSAKSRNLPSDAYVPFIQTDVAVNPGNSGGPLFNLSGEVIGINSQIYSRTGGYMGLSFAIPIDVAMKVKDDLLKYGKVQRGRIGVTIQQVNKDLAGTFGLDKARGALVSGVEKGGPADSAGLKVGDVILSVNGKQIDQSIDLPRIIGEGRPGSDFKLEIWREGKSREVGVKLGETPSEQLAEAAQPAMKPAKLGLVVRPLSAEETSRLQTRNGVVVERAEGPAAKAGIRPGDVIVALNSEPVDSPEKLRSLIEHSKDRVAILVQRNDARFFVPVPLS